MSETTERFSDVAAALDEARPNAEVFAVAAELMVLAHRNDVQLQPYDLERFAARPTRQKDVVQVHSAEGFVNAIDQRNIAEDRNAPAVYVDKPDRILTCVLDDVSAEGTAWRDHRIVFRPVHTDEWKHWTSHQGLRDQESFADVLEVGEAELHDPAPGVMLDLAQTFAANVSVRARSATRIRSGQVQFAWEEDIEATAGSDGTASIPSEFTIRVRPFYGSAAVEVRCRLRFRLRDGKLQLGYQLVRPEDVERAAFDTVVAEAVESFDGPIIYGAA